MVALAVDGPVATLTLDRPEKRNALNGAFAREIADAMDRAADGGARILVIRSSGTVFCAGVDVSEPIRLDDESPELVVARAILGSPLLIVTVIEGPALAGGLIIAALSPVVVAGEDASFWLPERSMGLFPGRVLAFLEEVMPSRHAFWLGLTEARIDAERAMALGLVSDIARGDVDRHVASLASQLADQGDGFLTAARDAWAARFESSAHLQRREVLDRVLARNLGRQVD